MTDDITPLRPEYLKQYAKTFVDLYETEGREAAGNFLFPKIEKHEYNMVSKYVEDEFESRGYKFPHKTYDDGAA